MVEINKTKIENKVGVKSALETTQKVHECRKNIESIITILKEHEEHTGKFLKYVEKVLPEQEIFHYAESLEGFAALHEEINKLDKYITSQYEEMENNANLAANSFMQIFFSDTDE